MSRGPRGNDLDDTLDQVDALYAQAQEAIGAYSPETAAGLLDRAEHLPSAPIDSADPCSLIGCLLSMPSFDGYHACGLLWHAAQ